MIVSLSGIHRGGFSFCNLRERGRQTPLQFPLGINIDQYARSRGQQRHPKETDAARKVLNFVTVSTANRLTVDAGEFLKNLGPEPVAAHRLLSGGSQLQAQFGAVYKLDQRCF
ncbi:hypothetical protein GKIL_4398 [Gloeobacter kilaueensis JS1]|uniref:Uncharacterized protein n=1 Tax=Gloeobacter kilaueensis (strain ATCC BAA-2537 / CCAP 1431/1 / ULC 316 / JS1) TaxID=1183438 RepID=U5QSJ4_GLOK1|nr:hypothetical protein GKIL_4398 [Gloeobacter kilaueensis JS1]